MDRSDVALASEVRCTSKRLGQRPSFCPRRLQPLDVIAGSTERFFSQSLKNVDSSACLLSSLE